MINSKYNATTNSINIKYSNINSSNVDRVKAKSNYMMGVVNLDNNMDTVIEDNNVRRSRHQLDMGIINSIYNSTNNTIDYMMCSNINSSNMAGLEAKSNYMMGVVNTDNIMTDINEDNVRRSRHTRDIEMPLICRLNHKRVDLRVRFYEEGNPLIEYKYEDRNWKTVNIKRKDDNLSLSNGIRVTIPIKKIIWAAYENKSITELNYKQIKYRDENKDINELYNINNLFISNSWGNIEPENVSQHYDRYDTASEHSYPSSDEQPIRGSDGLSAPEPHTHDEAEQHNNNYDEQPIRGSDGLSAPEPHTHDEAEQHNNNYDEQPIRGSDGLSAPEPHVHDDNPHQDNDDDDAEDDNPNQHEDEELELEEYKHNGETLYIDRNTNAVYKIENGIDSAEQVGDINSHPEDEDE